MRSICGGFLVFWYLRAVDEIQSVFRKWNCICGAFYAYAEGKLGGRLAEVPGDGL